MQNSVWVLNKECTKTGIIWLIKKHNILNKLNFKLFVCSEKRKVWQKCRTFIRINRKKKEIQSDERTVFFLTNVNFGTNQAIFRSKSFSYGPPFSMNVKFNPSQFAWFGSKSLNEYSVRLTSEYSSSTFDESMLEMESPYRYTNWISNGHFVLKLKEINQAYRATISRIINHPMKIYFFSLTIVVSRS